MASVRKKRNFKGLALDASPLAASPAGEAAGIAAGAPRVSAAMTPGGTNLAMKPPASAVSSATTTGGGKRTSNYHNKLTEQLASLELGVEYKLDLKNEDLTTLNELGAGNGGTVTKVMHEKSKTIMAKKVIFIDAKPTVRKQILRELQIMHDCNSKYIVSFYGAYLSEPHICLCMEYMDKGSLDTIYKRYGPIEVDIIGRIVTVVLEGLTYLYDKHRIIHRDVKPSNILVNSQGQIKICDFGVSGELINSIADTFVGTSTYMSPERIQGDQYSVKSDVWSLGISVIELACGRFPFAGEDDSDLSDADHGTLSPTRPTPASIEAAKEKERKRRSKGGVSLAGSAQQMSILDLLQHIVNEPAPKLPEGKFSTSMEDFVDRCLLKDPAERETPKELLKHPFVIQSEEKRVDVKAWTDSLT